MEANIRIFDKRVVWLDSQQMSEFEQNADWICRRLEGCTACVCYNDVMANKLLAVCRSRGIGVPEDLSVISIDNSDVAAYCEVPLTSAENPIRDLAKIAALEMLDMIDGKKVPHSTELEGEIVTRVSVAILEQPQL